MPLPQFFFGCGGELGFTAILALLPLLAGGQAGTTDDNRGDSITTAVGGGDAFLTASPWQ
jgi:hypothetical protein